MTRTVAHLEISAAAFEEIKAKLAAAGYQHAFSIEGEPEHEAVIAIDMHGIAVIPTPDPLTDNAISDGEIRRIAKAAIGKSKAERIQAFERICGLFGATFEDLHPDGVCRHEGVRHGWRGQVVCPLMTRAAGESAPAADQTVAPGDRIR